MCREHGGKAISHRHSLMENEKIGSDPASGIDDARHAAKKERDNMLTLTSTR